MRYQTCHLVVFFFSEKLNQPVPKSNAACHALFSSLCALDLSESVF